MHQHATALGPRQPRDRIVEHKTDFVCDLRVRMAGGAIGSGLSMSILVSCGSAPTLHSTRIGDGAAGDGKQPCGQHGVVSKRIRFAHQHDEHRLRHIGRQMRIAQLPPGRSVHQADIPRTSSFSTSGSRSIRKRSSSCWSLKGTITEIRYDRARLGQKKFAPGWAPAKMKVKIAKNAALD